ncbi:hypothetical protein PIB30_086731 [Stylosanthes scabra]|uniref:DUF4283 domain-containing protein n=1 Tax=Stylosanthes scabra TaxID=79078 RepID=A0ABU6TSU5_9FABA|nr:hypothetical protein [Stylosanthes scabra]
MERVLKGDPWIFSNSWLLVKRWDRKEEPEEKGLEEADIKIQLWNLPEHCKTAKLGRKIASVMGEVKECEVYENTKDQIRFVKATAAKDDEKVMNRSKKIGAWMKAESPVSKVKKGRQGGNNAN